MPHPNTAERSRLRVEGGGAARTAAAMGRVSGGGEGGGGAVVERQPWKVVMGRGGAGGSGSGSGGNFVDGRWERFSVLFLTGLGVARWSGNATRAFKTAAHTCTCVYIAGFSSRHAVFAPLR